MLKRAMDLALALVLCVPSAPLAALVAMAVKLDSSGPIFFLHTRVGLDGRLISVRKFRTMHEGSVGPSITALNDSRVTSSGAFLRRTKLDELPQLLNVLDGTMSLVGPRPEVPEYVALWPEAQRAVILSVRPGITDPAAVVLWNEEAHLGGFDHETTYRQVIMPMKLDIYERYVRERSILGDLTILAGTFLGVFVSAAGVGRVPRGGGAGSFAEP